MDGVESGWMNERADLWKEWMEGMDGWKERMVDVMCMVRRKIRRRVIEGESGGRGFGKDKELPESQRNSRTETVFNGVEGGDAVDEECVHCRRTLFPQD